MGHAARSLLRQSLRKTRHAALTAGLLAAALLTSAGLQARERPSTDTFPSVQRAELPAEALATERLIRAGGPFPYAKDGSVFGNRERRLPRKPRGFYREYTVTPPQGSVTRGPRRIVCGGEPPTRPEACYYTDDHYASFRRIVQ